MNNNGFYRIPNNNTRDAMPSDFNFVNTPPDISLTDLLNSQIGNVASFYMSFPDSVEWRDRIFTGTIKSAARDFFFIYNEEEREWYILWAVYVNYIVFKENNKS